MSITTSGRSLGPLVSVVTPFHNTARYLDECIRSVLAQSHENLEYILHDNASNDGSTEIAQGWAAKESRIKYFRQDRLIDQVPNYNQALSHISPDSKYCKIVQADDWICRTSLESMVDLAEQHSRVGVVSSYRLVGGAVGGEGLPYTQSVLTGRDAARLHLLEQVFLFGSPTTVLFRSEVVRARVPFYAEGRLHEDTEACYEILRDWDFGFVHQILSYSRTNPDSTYGRTRDYDPGILDKFIILHRYGSEYLLSHEFADRKHVVEQRYYRRIARAFLMAREADYWRFHRRGRATQGLKIDPAGFAKAMARELLSLIACPQQVFEIVAHWMRPKRQGATP